MVKDGGESREFLCFRRVRIYLFSVPFSCSVFPERRRSV